MFLGNLNHSLGFGYVEPADATTQIKTANEFSTTQDSMVRIIFTFYNVNIK